MKVHAFLVLILFAAAAEAQQSSESLGVHKHNLNQTAVQINTPRGRVNSCNTFSLLHSPQDSRIRQKVSGCAYGCLLLVLIRGSTTRTRHPLIFPRFKSSIDPPCASAI